MKSATYRPDKTDWRIMDILSIQYTPNNAIAKEIGVSEGTIRQRLKRLKEAGVLSIRALINPEILDNKQLAVVSANVAESRLLEQKAQEILGLHSVLSVSIMSGRYDLFIEVLVDSNRGLMRFLTEELASIEGISKTESFVALKTFNRFV